MNFSKYRKILNKLTEIILKKVEIRSITTNKVVLNLTLRNFEAIFAHLIK